MSSIPTLNNTQLIKNTITPTSANSQYISPLLLNGACSYSEISAIEKQALLKYHDRIVAAIDVGATVKVMLAERVFTKTVAQEVTQTTPSERVRRMLSVIKKRGDRSFRTMCEELKRNHPELAYLLLKETYRKDEEIFW